MLCNESSNIRDGPAGARQWPVPWRYGWPSIRQELDLYLENSADFFRQLSVRRHFKWLLSWFSRTAHTNVWLSGCPLGVLTLRLYTVLISNDADRCIQMRDARMGLELLHVPLGDVADSGWPAFRILAHLAEESRRISFPLNNGCDDLDSAAARSYRELLRSALFSHQRVPVPVAEALNFIEEEKPPRCSLGLGATYFALASQKGDARVRRKLLEQGQEVLLEWPSLQRSLYALLTTKWPVWQALDRIQKPPVQEVLRTEEGQGLELDVIFCGHGVDGMEHTLRHWCERKNPAWRLHFLRADLAACPGFYQTLSLPVTSNVLMLSPLLWSADGLEAAVDAMNFSLLDAGADVLGFPTLDSSLLWTFAVHRVVGPSRTPWRLRYEAFPTGYEETLKDRCFRGDAVSMTRGFKVPVWQKLVKTLRPSMGLGTSEEEMSWFVDLDLEIINAGLKSYLCMGPPAQEDPYLPTVRLANWLARKYAIEEAHFAEDNVQQLCVGPPMPPGSTVPPCLQQEAQLAWHVATEHWKDVRLRLNGPALLTAGRSLLGDTMISEVDVCDGGTLLCSSLADILPSTLMVETELERCTFRSAREGSEAFILPALLRVNRAQDAKCQEPMEELFQMRGKSPTVLLSLDLPEPGGSPRDVAPPAHVISCGELPPDLPEVWQVHRPDGSDLSQHGGAQCLEFLKRTLDLIPDGVPVVFLSPTLVMEHWSSRCREALSWGLQQLTRGDAAILSFPRMETRAKEKFLAWRARKLRHQYWKLDFSGVDQISEDRGVNGEACALGIASMTRLFRSAKLLKFLVSAADVDPENAWNWFLDLDLEIHHQGLKVLSCGTWPMPEDDHITWMSLTTHLAEKHQIEMVNFDGRQEVVCIKGANWFQVAQKGLVAPYCFRRDVMKAFRSLQQWWTSLDSRNFLVPEEGTFLALFRNGAAGIMPWDSDFDVKMYTEQDITMEGFMNRTLEPAFKSMQIEAYAYDGCGQDSYVLLRQANITHHIGDAYVRGSQRKHPWRARLFGTEISLSPEHLEHIFFTRYRTPVAKLFGDGIPLQCFHVGHNACMPDCRDPETPCDFEDDFVHV